MRKKFLGENTEFYRTVASISDVADKGVSALVSMGSQKKMPFSLDDLHFIPAQIAKIPLNLDEPVNTKVTIGPQAKKPMQVSSPIMFSAMSYGAVTEKVRTILAKVAVNLNLGLKLRRRHRSARNRNSLAKPHCTIFYSTSLELQMKFSKNVQL